MKKDKSIPTNSQFAKLKRELESFYVLGAKGKKYPLCHYKYTEKKRLASLKKKNRAGFALLRTGSATQKNWLKKTKIQEKDGYLN